MNKIWYELDQNYYSNDNDKNYSFEGIKNVIKYFKSLQIDFVIMQQILNTYDVPNAEIIKNNESQIGSISKLRDLLKELKDNEIFPIMKFDLEKLKIAVNSYENLNKYLNNQLVVSRQNSSVGFLNNNLNDHKYITQSYFIKTNSNDFEKAWSANNSMDELKILLKFYKKIGFKGIVFHNFESIYPIDSKTNNVNSKTIAQLKTIYQMCKEIDREFLIVLETKNELKNSIVPLDKDREKFYDFIINNSLAEINKTTKFDIGLHVDVSKRNLSKMIEKTLNQNNNIFALQSVNSGRINSNWGDDYIFWEESAKSLIMLNLVHLHDKKIFSGQEVGLLNLNKSFFDKIKDFEVNEQKHKLADSGISVDRFNYSFVTLNPLNLKYPFLWSKEQQTDFDKYLDYKYETNVKSQWNNNYSVLNFYKKVSHIYKNDSFVTMLKTAKYKINHPKFNNTIIDYSIVSPKFTIRIFLNLSYEFIKVRLPKKYKVILSSYQSKKYIKKIRELDPYESIIILENPKNVEDDFIVSLFEM
ncbi:glucan 1,6-alpha-glucosidase [Mycoplasma testudineum]|uniref:Glucan 1,6-alpha-glucosidase n=1 Tax=Mycoplasma testudineum TaxID=244584 RepID=A0A4R6IH27_9MOLU|nr:hypothetical protein [Mycoplasma testudineum]OYD27138.1 hypothetical protein CG473_00645 [Mycoplasma testudineum]TDO21108.1 glucan 1,6-alpha-glucosidase [Mycoplasma testudineum]